MFIFPGIYIVSFLIALYQVLKKKPGSILLFFVFGLPIYITSLSIAFSYGLKDLIPVLQSFKEILVICTLGLLFYTRKKKLVLHRLDYLMLAFASLTALFIVLPVGEYGLMEKLLAFKSLSFFPVIYFTGRLMDPQTVDLNKYFHYICLVAILAAVVLAGEVIMNQHLQVYTGYADFNYYFFGQEPSGNYGLSWTFETANGIKRFASFFGGPLELGVNTLFTISVIVALATNDNNKIRPDWFIIVAFSLTVLSIFFAFSRASFASYFIILYVYSFVTKRKNWLKVFHYSAIAVTLFILFWLRGDIYDMIMSTIDFSDTSSAYHVFQWIEGIDALGSHPLGSGLGVAGRVSAETGSNVGGENQLIIIGVQTGLIAVTLYILIYANTIIACVRSFREALGKQRKLALSLLLIKVGLIIPVLTANVESYIYISYITWFCTGLLISMVQSPKEIVLSKE
jgi:hypothetical protein